jgi:hypothetical protein
VKASLSNENGGVVADTYAVFATSTGDIHGRAEIVLEGPKLKAVSASETLSSKRNQRDKNQPDKSKRNKSKLAEDRNGTESNRTESNRTETADL